MRGTPVSKDRKYAVGSLKLPFGASAPSFAASTSTERTISSVYDK